MRMRGIFREYMLSEEPCFKKMFIFTREPSLIKTSPRLKSSLKASSIVFIEISQYPYAKRVLHCPQLDVAQGCVRIHIHIELCRNITILLSYFYSSWILRKKNCEYQMLLRTPLSLHAWQESPKGRLVRNWSILPSALGRSLWFCTLWDRCRSDNHRALSQYTSFYCRTDRIL